MKKRNKKKKRKEEEEEEEEGEEEEDFEEDGGRIDAPLTSLHVLSCFSLLFLPDEFVRQGRLEASVQASRPVTFMNING